MHAHARTTHRRTQHMLENVHTHWHLCMWTTRPNKHVRTHTCTYAAHPHDVVFLYTQHTCTRTKACLHADTHTEPRAHQLPLFTHPGAFTPPWPFLSPDLHQALSLGKDSEREPRDLVKGGGSGSCARPCGEMEGPSPRTRAPARGSRPLRLVQAGARTAPQPIPAQWSQGQLPRGPQGCLTPPSIWKHPPPQLQSPGPGGGVETRTPGPMDSASTGS